MRNEGRQELETMKMSKKNPQKVLKPNDKRLIDERVQISKMRRILFFFFQKRRQKLTVVPISCLTVF